MVSFGRTTALSPAVRRDDAKGSTILIRECAPLCLAWIPAGAESRGWARIGATNTVAN